MNVITSYSIHYTKLYDTLEDGKQYAIIDEITENNNTYVYLSNISDETDFCIRKVKDEPKGAIFHF